jgi:hypothetical protein
VEVSASVESCVGFDIFTARIGAVIDTNTEHTPLADQFMAASRSCTYSVCAPSARSLDGTHHAESVAAAPMLKSYIPRVGIGVFVNY